MGLVCQRCNTNRFLMKQYLENGLMEIVCVACSWKTGKLDRHNYEQFVDNIPTSEEMHKEIDKWR